MTTYRVFPEPAVHSEHAPPPVLHQVLLEDGRLVTFRRYHNEMTDTADIARLCSADLSEPYIIYTYRYFLVGWPELAFVAQCEGQTIGMIMCKLEPSRAQRQRGYIGMLSVEQSFRRRGLAKCLANIAIDKMIDNGAQEISLETELSNQASLAFYEKLGFIQDKYLCRFYLNGQDAIRLIRPVVKQVTSATTNGEPSVNTHSQHHLPSVAHNS